MGSMFSTTKSLKFGCESNMMFGCGAIDLMIKSMTNNVNDKVGIVNLCSNHHKCYFFTVINTTRTRIWF